MPRRRQRHTLPALALLAGLVLPLHSVHSLPLSATAPHVSSPRTLASSVWFWLTQLFEPAWRKNGMAIDPNGQPGVTGPGPNGTAPVRGDNGSMPDPNG